MAGPLLVGHHEVRDHPRPDTGEVSAPLTPTPGVLGHFAIVRPHLAGVLVSHTFLDGPPPETLAALTGQRSVVGPRRLVSAHFAFFSVTIIITHLGFLNLPE